MEIAVNMLLGLVCLVFIFLVMLGIVMFIFFLYDVWRYDLRFIVKEFLFRKLNKN